MKNVELEMMRKRAVDLGNAAVIDGLPREAALKVLLEKKAEKVLFEKKAASQTTISPSPPSGAEGRDGESPYGLARAPRSVVLPQERSVGLPQERSVGLPSSGLVEADAVGRTEAEPKRVRIDGYDDRSSAISGERIELPADFAALGTTFHDGYEECLGLLKSAYPAVRRAAAGALVKFLERDPSLGALAKINLMSAIDKEESEQALQYTLRAMMRCAKYLKTAELEVLRDISRNPTRKGYVREAAAEAAAAAEREMDAKEARTNHWCTRCRRPITAAESAASMEKYYKPYCRHCFAERQHDDADFSRNVEAAKRLATTDGVAVQSKGEKRIGDWLAAQHIAYEYDERMVIAGGFQMRPDFYLPEFDIYIEYWGMDTPEYVANMKKKRFFYQREHKKLLSLSYKDFDNLE